MQRLLDIMARMRGVGGCPWDREQTLESLKQYLVEECYELVDAIDSGDVDRHKEELGDLLLQIVFQAQIRREQGAFTFADVVTQICDKLIRRHPHVFGPAKVSGSREVLRNWEAIKAQEKTRKTAPANAAAPSLVSGISRHLPALHKAHEIQKRVSRVGFDWTRVQDVVAKIEEELQEVKQALASGKSAAVPGEIGDLLFAVVNLSRFQGLNAEDTLNQTIRKFVRRFQAVEARVRAAGQDLSRCPPAELDRHWNAVKDDPESVTG